MGRCGNGYHNAHSDLPFGLTVWGWDQVVSYAYPAGAGVRVAVFGATRATADADTFFRQPGDLNLARSEVSLAATTDAEGRFTLRHLPPDYRFLVVFEAASMLLLVAAVGAIVLAGRRKEAED